MRVVQLVCSDGFAGVERYIVNLAVGLCADGIDVTVVGGAEVQMRHALETTPAIWRPGSTMLEAKRELHALRAVDIVNSHMSQADLIVSLTGTRRSFRRVSTRHFAAPRGSSRPAAAVFGPISRRIDAQLAISRFVAENVDGPSQVVHSGVATRPLGGGRRPEVLLVQRLEAEKDTETAIRAWALASARSRGWLMRIAGDGSQRAFLEGLASRLGVEESIEFLGFRADVDELLAHAGLLLAPTPREGLGISVLEAMAHGTPVIASAAGGHLETVGEVAPDLLFDASDPAEAARLIDELVADPARRESVGILLRERQQERFTLSGQVLGTRRLYERVLSR